MKAKLFILALLVSFSCQEIIQHPLKSENTDLIVVEALLTNENISHLVKISRPYGTQNQPPQPISGAEVTITDGSNTALLTETPAGSGHYITPPVRAVYGRTYKLKILYAGKTYEAQDSAVPVEALRPLETKKATGPNSYNLVLNESGTAPNFIQHSIRWANTPACQGGQACRGEVIFYDLKTIDVNSVFKPDKKEFVFPAGSIVVRKKYSVSQAYKTFLRGMLSETEWRGGVFDVDRANATTNLSAGAIGFFTVCTVVSDSVKIN